DDKVLWLLDRTDLFARYLKHEMYQVLMSTADASAPTRERLLTAALRGPDLPRDIEDRDRHVAYSIFNLLVWLSQHAPNWQEARDALGTTRELHPDFEPREHPDFDQWSWSGFVEPTPPM